VCASVCVYDFSIMKLITSSFLNVLSLSKPCFVHFAGLFSYTALTDISMFVPYSFLYTVANWICVYVYACMFICLYVCVHEGTHGSMCS
jgi:hypothetical protein